MLLPAAAGAQRVAVLPIQPVVEAKDKHAAFIEEKFHRELRAQGATLIVGDEIRRAMAKDFFYNPGKATDVADSWFREQVLRA